MEKEKQLTKKDVIHIMQEMFSVYQFPLRTKGSPHFHSRTAISAGGLKSAGILLSTTNDFGTFFGSGAPTISAAKGSMYQRSDGSSNTRFYINSDGSTTWVPLLDTIVDIDKMLVSFTVGEDITVGEAVRVLTGSITHLDQDGNDLSNQDIQGSGGNDEEWAAKFTIPTGGHIVTTVTYKVRTSGSPSDGLRVVIEGDSSGPDGSVKGTSSTVDNVDISSSYGIETFIFTSDVDLPAGDYWAVIQRTGSRDTNNKYQVAINNSGSAGGNFAIQSSGSWSTLTNISDITVLGEDGIVGQVKLANATTVFKANTFIGFADATISSGNSGNIMIGGIDDGQSGLSSGSLYYLSDTDGAISTSVGTVSKKIGVATSTTDILVRHDN